MTLLSGCQIWYSVQQSRSARTHSKQCTLLTEVQKSTKHQGEKDTGINCSEQITSSNSGVTTANQRNVFDPAKPISRCLWQRERFPADRAELTGQN